MLELLSRGDIPPVERRKMVDDLVATQPVQVQKAYKQYNDLLDQHAKKYGISLEAELEKARQDYLAKQGTTPA
uniref:Peptidylprolyl isomerase n=2 Tax=Bursaphelenchus xylophilus TaxID=6326 RepID=A0A1I7SGH5_BURXY